MSICYNFGGVDFMKITVGVSNRHAHLTEEVYNELFQGKKIEKRNDLNQVCIDRYDRFRVQW